MSVVLLGFLSRLRSVQFLHEDIEGTDQLAQLNLRHGLLLGIGAARYIILFSPIFVVFRPFPLFTAEIKRA